MMSDTPRTDALIAWEWIPGQHAFTQLEKHYGALTELARQLERENAALRKRLECEEGMPDGIYCRDETIRILEKRLAEANLRIERLITDA